MRVLAVAALLGAVAGVGDPRWAALRAHLDGHLSEDKAERRVGATLSAKDLLAWLRYAGQAPESREDFARTLAEMGFEEDGLAFAALVHEMRHERGWPRDRAVSSARVHVEGDVRALSRDAPRQPSPGAQGRAAAHSAEAWDDGRVFQPVQAHRQSEVVAPADDPPSLVELAVEEAGTLRDAQQQRSLEGAVVSYVLIGLAATVVVVLLVYAAVRHGRYRMRQATRLRDEKLLLAPTVDEVTAVRQTLAITEAQKVELGGGVPELCALLPDKTPIGALSCSVHPWAAEPQTVGCLAALQLAALAQEDPFQTAQELVACGGGDHVVQFLAGPGEDRVHAGLVVCGLLSPEEVFARRLQELEATHYLAKCLEVAVGARPRASALVVLRSLFFYDPEAKRAWAREHGLSHFTSLVGERVAKGGPEAELQLGAFANLVDLTFLHCARTGWTEYDGEMIGLMRECSPDLEPRCRQMLETLAPDQFDLKDQLEALLESLRQPPEPPAQQPEPEKPEQPGEAAPMDPPAPQT